VTGGEDRFMAAMHQMRDAFQVLKEDAPWGAYDAENGQFYDGYAEVKEMFAVALAASETVRRVLGAGCGDRSPGHVDVPDRVQLRHARGAGRGVPAPVRAHPGQGCRYRKVQVEETVTRTVTVLP